MRDVVNISGWEKDEDHEEGQNNVRNKKDEGRHQSI